MEYEETEKKLTAGKVVRIVATVFVFVVIGLFVIRCWMVADKSRFSDPIPTDALRSAWADGESGMLTVKISAELAKDGYFSAYGFYFNPESGEAQFAVRWNRSVYSYTDMPEGHEFTFYLLNETTGAVYPASAVESASMSIYQYRRMIAEGVSVGEDEQLTAVMELRDEFDSRQVLKYAEQPFNEYRLKGKLLKQLAP